MGSLNGKDAPASRLYFDWRTEEELRWESSSQPPPSRSPRRRWLWLLVFLLLLLGVWVALWQILQRADEGEASVEAELLATHQFVQQTAVTGDVELFRSLLSGRDPAWTAQQEALVQARLLFAPQPFGMTLRPFEDGMASAPLVSFSPDLNAAELAFTPIYTAWHPFEGQTQVQLTQTAVYRLGETGGWLYSPPAADFWGESRQLGSEMIALTFPARDAVLATRLLADLSRRLEPLCQQELPCSEPLTVHFSTDPATLLALASPEAMLGNLAPVVLPTPTLVGLPVDEASYEFLVTAYAALLAQALLLDGSGYACCRNAHIARAIVDRQLADWSLRAWPLSPDAYQQLLLDGFHPERVSTLWQAGAAESAVSAPIYAFVDWLAHENSPSRLLKQLAAQERYTVWLEKVLPANVTLDRLTMRWLEFVETRTASALLADPPRALPTEPIQFACTTSAQASILLEYLPTTNRARQLFKTAVSPQGSMLLTPLPDGHSLVLEERSGALEQPIRMTLWRDGQRLTLLESEGRGAAVSRDWFFLGVGDANGRYLQLGYYDRTAATYSFFLADTANCPDGNCERLALAGKPLWSPTGEKLIVFPFVGNGDPASGLIWLSEGNGQTLQRLTVGFSPFWLADQQVAFLRQEANGGESLWSIGAEPTAEAMKLLTTEMLQAALPLDDEATILRFGEIVVHPDRADWLTIVAMATQNGVPYWQLFRFENGRSPVHLARYETAVQVAFSPDGRWLEVNQIGDGEGQMELWRSDGGLAQRLGGRGLRFSEASSHWSPDGEWLLYNREQYALLYAPNDDYVKLLPLDLSRCYQAVWTTAP